MPFGKRRNRIDRSLRERGVPPEPQHKDREIVETSGPWDVTDAPDDGLPRVDLGALRLPARPGTELRVDLNQQQKVIGATLRYGDSLLQVAPQVIGSRRRLNSLDQRAQLVLHTSQLLQHRVRVRTHNRFPECRIAAGDAREVAQTLASQHEVLLRSSGEAARDQHRHQVRQV